MFAIAAARPCATAIACKLKHPRLDELKDDANTRAAGCRSWIVDRMERWATLASMPERCSAMAKAVALWSALNSEHGIMLSKAPAGAPRSHSCRTASV